MRSKPRYPSSRGFTLIELLTVIAIIGILAAIIIPTVGRVRLQGRVAQSGSNLRQVAMGLTMLAELNRGYYPSGEFDPGTASGAVPYNFWKAERGLPSILYPQIAAARKAEFGAWYGQHKAVIDGTVFASPLRESDTSPVLSAISYGYNYEITRNGQKLRLAEIYPPAQTLIVADVFKTNQLRVGGLNARNGASSEYARDGRTLVGYLDGHVESLTRAETDELNDNQTDRAKLAWGRR
ncbi:MAG: prepilin-type N-terminal cleavage/methylation domain-containing protein [Opitutaceae bacterium]|jgi:prepilin-type N-terminal cleavage/methylation domain-containing protein|nr:prepilin-type N-terminal cleavage/methylation domain-containing protein [Opitutaceae bacterium]